jgi:hypothetical protein
VVGCVSSFYLIETIYLRKQLKGGKIYFGSRCQSIMEGKMWQKRAVHITVTRKVKRGYRKSPGKDIAPRTCSQ